MTTETTGNFKRKLQGVVVSAPGSKTIVVTVNRKYKHPKYEKFITASKKYHAHDEAGKAAVGNAVTIIESRPHSKLKRWELFQVN